MRPFFFAGTQAVAIWTPRFRFLLGIVCIVTFGAVVYWPGLGGGFIFDDFSNLVRDPDWKASSLSFAELHRAMALGIASDLGRPLALLSFAINHAFTGLDPYPLKLTGLALHLFNGVLVFLLCQRLFVLASPAESRARMGQYAAALVAMAWVVHPLQVSSALYIVQRMEVGAHTGVLLALLAYIRARNNQLTNRPSWPWFGAAGAAMLIGLGFKETALLVPAYALALELFVFGFRTAGARRSQTLIYAYAAGIAIALGVFLLIFLPRYLPASAYAYRDFTLAERLLTQLPVLKNYLGQILLPLPGNLLFYYDQFPISRSLLDPPATLGALMVLLSLAVAGWLARRQWPLVALGVAWFFIAHALTSNVVPLELAFEHRNYFALLGILLAAAQLLAWATRRLHMDARRTLALLPVLLLAGLCMIQTHTWGDPFRLAMALASRNPESPRANYDLGQRMLFMAGTDRESPMLSLAIRQFEHAAALPNSPPLPEQALIITHARSGREVPTELWQSVRSKLSRRRAGVQEIAALHGILDCHLTLKCALDDQELFQTFLTAVENNPRSARILVLYSELAYRVLGEPALAIEVARETTRLAPDNLQLRVNLARMMAAHGEHPEELDELVRYIQAKDVHGRYRDETVTGFGASSSASE